MHGCARFFNAVRDTVSDKFVTTYKAGEPKPDLSKLAVASDQAASAKRPAAETNRKPGANGES
jgi:sarcosine oxidase subunit delta